MRNSIIYIYIYIYINQFHLYHSVNIYINWLQEQICNLSLCTLYVLYVQINFLIESIQKWILNRIKKGCSSHYPVKQSRYSPGGAPEGSRKLRFPDLVTTAQDGGNVVNLTHRPPLPPGNTAGTHFCYRLSRPQGHSAIGRILCQ